MDIIRLDIHYKHNETQGHIPTYITPFKVLGYMYTLHSDSRYLAEPALFCHLFLYISTHFTIDGGYTWYQLASTNAWRTRSWPSLFFDLQGLLYVGGGETGSSADADMYVSTQSFNQIGWLTQISPSFTIPSRNGGCLGLACLPGSSSCVSNCYASSLSFSQITNSIVSGARQNEHIEVYPSPIAYLYNPGASSWTTGITYPVINVTTPNSAFVLWGGQSGYGTGSGNVWISTDAHTWSIISGYGAGNNPNNPTDASSGYQGLGGICAMGDYAGVLYTTGGININSASYTPPGAPGNRTEIALDAQHWTVTSYSGVGTPQTQYGYRAYHQCAVDPLTNYAYVMNGYSSLNTSNSEPRVPQADVWQTTNRGSSWTLVASNPPYSPRYSAALQAYYSSGLQTSVFVLIAGCTVNQNGAVPTEAALNDIWISTGGAANWQQVASSAPFSARCMFGSATTSQGVLVIGGGRTSGAYQSTSTATYDDLWTSLGQI